MAEFYREHFNSTFPLIKDKKLKYEKELSSIDENDPNKIRLETELINYNNSSKKISELYPFLKKSQINLFTSEELELFIKYDLKSLEELILINKYRETKEYCRTKFFSANTQRLNSEGKLKIFIDKCFQEKNEIIKNIALLKQEKIKKQKKIKERIFKDESTLLELSQKNLKPPSSEIQWEYQEVTIIQMNKIDFLNKAGEYGWEFISDIDGLIMLKRKIL